jgi:hypothetical protein
MRPWIYARRVMGSPRGSRGPSPNELLLSPSVAEDTIRYKCQQEWRDDFRMQAYCESKQNEGLAACSNASGSPAPGLRAAQEPQMRL